jgi:hypothetical protein
VLGQVIRFCSMCHSVGCRGEGVKIGLFVWVVKLSGRSCLQIYSCSAKTLLHITCSSGHPS